MNTQTDTLNTMQSTEAAALEDKSLPANEVLTAQQSALAEETFTPTFIP